MYEIITRNEPYESNNIDPGGKTSIKCSAKPLEVNICVYWVIVCGKVAFSIMCLIF